MNLSTPGSEVVAVTARNRIKEGRYILISLSGDRPMVLKDGIIALIDYKRALIALYEELGEVVPSRVIKAMENHFYRESSTSTVQKEV